MKYPICDKCDCVDGCGANPAPCPNLAQPKHTAPITHADWHAKCNMVDALKDKVFALNAKCEARDEIIVNLRNAYAQAIAQPEQTADLADRIKREIDHCIMNDLRLVPNFGRRKGDLAVRVACLEAILETIAQPEQPAAVGKVMAPHYRGYANLGSGQYVLNHTADLPAELIISIATEEEKAGRAVGDSRSRESRAILHPKDMAVRLRFENVSGLDALEQQLRFLREELFPESIVGTK